MAEASKRPVCTLRAASARAADWLKIFGRLDSIPVKSWIAHWAELPGIGDSIVYMLDLERITAEERVRLIAHIAERFKFPLEVVAQDLDAEGVPILADDVTVVSFQMDWL